MAYGIATLTEPLLGESNVNLLRYLIALCLAFNSPFSMATNEPGKTIRLVCKISDSLDDKGYSPTSGNNLLTVTFLDEGRATIRKQG